MTSRFPFPLEKGDKLRAYYQIKELSKHFDLKLIALSDQPVLDEHKQELLQFCSEIHVFPISKASYLWNAAKHFLLGKSFQVGYFYNRKWIKETQLLLEKWKPSHIYTQLVRCTEYTKNYHHCPKTLDYMDALATGIDRRGQKSNPLLRWVFQKEGERLKEYERRVFEYYDFKTIISEQDRRLIKHPNQQKIFAVPNGIDQSFLQYEGSYLQRFDIGFIGNMAYPPNVDAVHYIQDHFLRNHPQIQFLIAGANPQPSVIELGKQKNITVAGWVDDIRTSYADMKVFVAPMQIGTGMQNKLLEAMAMGIPCITTSLANNAIGGIHRYSIWVVETPQELSDAIHHLLQHPREAQEMGQRAKEWVAQTYSWEKSTELLVSLIQNKPIKPKTNSY